ncbi:conserved hypothetical protein [Bradyrhizobium sp. ORS 375]|uniref:hypothetical protein n=1 Tax=Bradyrhizobium sp. (strain ORS 375) TaxID=566679 RepID=UPI0002405ED4|nr:hypothetical protein [Bradyrhizobium sp. ORS 375]CCD95258.1 conserved hypothetical protein [Bradyrhizobium sp. ORS 375]
MADADLDAVIRQLAKQQNKAILAAAKKRKDRFNGLATKAKDKDAKERFKMLARESVEQANAAARRLLISADNVADSYARAMRQAAAAELPKPPPEKKAEAATAKPAGGKAAKKAAKAAPKKAAKSKA